MALPARARQVFMSMGLVRTKIIQPGEDGRCGGSSSRSISSSCFLCQTWASGDENQRPISRPCLVQFTERAVNPVCCAAIFRLAGLSGDVRRPRCSAGLACVGLEQKQFFWVNVDVKKKKKKQTNYSGANQPHVLVLGGRFNSRCRTFSNLLNTAEVRLMGDIKVKYRQDLL